MDSYHPDNVGSSVRTPGQTQVAFLHMDPILKNLLSLVTTYRELTGVVKEQSNERNQPMSDWIDNVKSQLVCLEQFQAALQKLGHAFSPSLLVMADYISLPMIAIFAVSDDLEPRLQDMANAAVLLSYLRQLQTATARCIHKFVEMIYPVGQGDSPIPKVSLSPKHCIQFLVALTRGFPATMNATKTDDNRKALDDGSDALMAVFQAMKLLIGCLPSQELMGASQGGLLARLVDCSATVLEGSVQSHHAAKQEAANVLLCLLNYIEDPKPWQAMFPGVLLALYRCLVSCHRQASTGQSVQLECACLKGLCRLLSTTLQPSHQEVVAKDSGYKNASKIVHSLQLLASRANETHASTPLDKESTPEADAPANFISQVQKRAVAPLVLVLKQGMTYKSFMARCEVIQLCQVILIETLACWRGTSLPEAAVECGLIFLNDEADERVANASMTMLQNHQDQIGIHDRAAIVSKIRSLVEALPTLSEGGKTLETRVHLQLLRGYVETLATSKELAITSFSYLPFIQFMEVDTSAAAQPNRPLPVNNKVSLKGHLSKLPIQRLNLENTRLAGDVLIAFGRCLGPKQGAYVIDGLVTEMLNAWSREVQPTLLSLKDWAGRLVVATKILIGAFLPGTSEPGKEARRRRKILLSLASSVLPLVLDLRNLFWTNTQPSSQISEAMAAVVIASLEFLAVMVDVLEDDTAEFVTVVLYPTIDILHITNNTAVQETAKESIWRVARACNILPMNVFLRREAAHVYAEMLSSLRVPGGSTINRGGELSDALRVAFALTWVLNELLKGRLEDGNGEKTRDLDQPATSSLIELGNILVDRLDVFVVDGLIPEEKTFELTKFYTALFDYLSFVFELERPDAEKSEKDRDRYLTHVSTADDTEDKKWPSPIENEIAQATGSKIQLSSKIIFRACYFLSNESLRVQISACESLARGFEFLSVCSDKYRHEESQEIRNAIFRQVATSWPSIKARLSRVTDEVLGDQRTIQSLLVVSLFQEPSGQSVGKRDIGIQRFFLSRLVELVASMFECSGDFMADRLKSNVWPIFAKQFESIMQKDQGKRQQGGARVMVQGISSQCLDIVSAEDDIIVPQRNNSERHLLLSTLRCLERVFGSEGSHETSLVRIHQAVGIVVLPFVGDPDGEVSSSAVAVIKHIAAQNHKVLLRPLLEMSGRNVSSEESSARDTIIDCSETRRTTATTSSKLEARCEEILSFIETLPEDESQEPTLG